MPKIRTILYTSIVSEEHQRTVAHIQDGKLVTRSQIKKPDDDALYQQEVRKSLAIASNLGLSIVLPTLLGLFLGQWIDRTVHTDSTFTLLLFGIGLFIGISNIVLLIQKK